MVFHQWDKVNTEIERAREIVGTVTPPKVDPLPVTRGMETPASLVTCPQHTCSHVHNTCRRVKYVASEPVVAEHQGSAATAGNGGPLPGTRYKKPRKSQTL